jgi:hypothetical protein
MGRDYSKGRKGKIELKKIFSRVNNRYATIFAMQAQL